MTMTNYNDMQTEELINELISSELLVPSKLAEEITRRQDAIPHLIHIIESKKYHELDGPGDGWATIHAIFILSTFKTPEVLAAILNLLKQYGENFDDWLTEDIPSVLVKFGIEAAEPLKEIVLDETIYIYTRNAASRALAVLAHQHPETRDSIVSMYREILKDDNDELIDMLIDELAQFKDDDAFDEIKSVFERGIIDEFVINMEDVEHIYNTPDEQLGYHHDEKDPMDHFSPSNIEYLWKANYDDKYSRKLIELKKEKKIGRNDPCPCGSGKKYKKCCLKK